MAKAKITKKAIESLRGAAADAGKPSFLYDGELTGFGAKASPAGTVSYFVEYWQGGRGGRSRRVTLGRHGPLTPEQARTQAKAKLGEVAKGGDPAQDKKDVRLKLKAGTFKEAAERFLDSLKVKDRSESYRIDVGRMLSQDAIPALGSTPLASITRAQVAALVDKVAMRSPSLARALFAVLRPLFKWAVERGMIERSPMDGMRGPAAMKARERALSEAEIKAFWEAASQVNWPFENIFKLLLLTGQRREEVAGVSWAELDLDAGEWTIPKERTKNGKAHVVHLSPAAIEMLDRVAVQKIKEAWGIADSDLVFSTTGKTPPSGFSRAKRRLDALMEKNLGRKLEPWRTHDLRRTAASGMAGLGALPQVIERVLNHVSGVTGGLVGVYQRHEYGHERRAAILAWGQRVEAIVSGAPKGGNVVPLRKLV